MQYSILILIVKKVTNTPEGGKEAVKTEITICIGSSCHLRGSREIIEKLEKLVKENSLEDKVELKGSFCMGQCQKGVCVTLDGELHSLSPDGTEEFFNTYLLGGV